MLLRATARLQAAMGSPPLVDLPGGEADKWEWYGNVVRLDRRAHLLLVHAETLFPVLSPHGTRTALRHAGPLVTGLITDALTDEDLPADTFGLLDPTKVRIAKTASRRVLGTMTDMTQAATHLLDRTHEPDALDDVNRQLRRWLCGRDGDYVVPLELARALTTPSVGADRRSR
jgi:hypothetical protein